MITLKNLSIHRKKINLNELAFDAALFIFPFILERFYDSMAALQPLGLPFIQLFLAGTLYFLPLLIGRMYNTDFAASPEPVRKGVIFILSAAMIFAFGNLLYLIIPTVNQPESQGMFILVTAIVFSIMGPIAGFMFTKKGAPVIEGASTQMVVFLFTAGMLPLFYVLMSGDRLFGDTGMFFGLLIVFGLMILDVVLIILLYAGYVKCKKMITASGMYDTGVFIVRLLTPFCVSFMFVFFNINSDNLFMGQSGAASTGSIVLIIMLYIFSGVLPLRIMMMLTPPVKPLNAAMGVLSAAYLIIVIVMK
jgi:hypothetical protein